MGAPQALVEADGLLSRQEGLHVTMLFLLRSAFMR